MPPVTADRSPPDSRMTGADSPVIADSSTEATPSMISPSPGMNSPAWTMTTSSLRRLAAGTCLRSAAGSSRLATVSVRVLRSVSACALPRPSAIASAKLANSTVNHSQNATCPVNSGLPPSAGQLLDEDDRRQEAADLDDEHHRVLDLDPRVELAERIERPPAGRCPDPRSKSCVRVLTWSSLTASCNATAQCCTAAIGAPIVSSRRSARFNSSTLTRARPRNPNVGGSVCVANQLADPLDGHPRAAAPGGLQLRRRRRDMRIHAAAAGGHHLRRHLAGRHALLLDHRVEPLLDRLQVIRIRRPVVRAAGRCGVVVDAGRPRLEVLRPRELLGDQPRADDRAVGAPDQAAFGLRRKRHAPDAPEQRRCSRRRAAPS